MLFEIFIVLILGLIAGTITGLIPGLHVNLIALLLFASSALFLQFTTPLILIVFIVSMSITHTFVDFIPAIFLGAPNEDTALSVLPGHKMLLEGYGYGAVRLTAIGSFFGLLIALALVPFFLATASFFYPFLVKAMAFILIAIALFLILKENKKFWAFFIFALSGVLGFAALNFPWIKQPFFPLFSGLFGASLLAISAVKNVKLPKQIIKSVKAGKKETVKALGASIFSGSLVSFLPGVGAGQAAVISTAFGKISQKGFLILVGAINTIVMALSFVALYVIQKPRTGTAVIIGKLIPDFFSLQNLFLLLAVALVAGSLALFLTLFLAKGFAKNIIKINYKWLCFGILGFLVIMTVVLSGWLALLVLAVGTAIGITTSIIGIRKIHMMGCLMLPVIIWYLV